MSKGHLRKIILDGQAYLWKFTPHYEEDKGGQWRCHDIFVAYILQDKQPSLQVHFITWESPITGGPLRTGASIDLNHSNTGGINLHQPGFAAQIIRQGLIRGWRPLEGRSLVIEDGITLLAEIGYQAK